MDIKRANEIALAMETACKEAKFFKTTDVNVCKITSTKPSKKFVKKQEKKLNKPPTKSVGNCRHCGKRHKDECTFKNATCYKCKVKGHIATICRNPSTNYVEEFNEMHINTVSVCAVMEHKE